MQHRHTNSSEFTRKILVLLAIFLFFSCSKAEKKQIDPSIVFLDENGKKSRLGDYLYKTPVIFTPVYFKCPSVCNLQLNRLAEAMQKIKIEIGRDVSIVSLSFNPAENPQIAKEKKKAYMKMYNLPGGESDWHFLTGKFEDIKTVTKSLDFEYYIDRESREYIHKPVSYFLDRNGNVIHALSGSKIEPGTVKMLIVAASLGEYGTISDRLLWFFLQFDEKNATLKINLGNGIRFVLVTFLVMVLILGYFRESKKKKTRV